MPLSLVQTQAVAELAEFLAGFLPGTPNPFADPAISFQGVATRLGLGAYWSGGSKTPAVTSLLERTLSRSPKTFCTLVLDVVRNGIRYRQKKDPLTREDIGALNILLRRVGFQIKDLQDPAFLEALPQRGSARTASQHSTPEVHKQDAQPAPEDLARLKGRLDEIATFSPTNRGFAFEVFLAELFQAFGLAPRSSFRIVGEQIDGSCEVSGNTYLVEAKWQSKKTGQEDLLVLSGKLGGKAPWARGLFISFAGFSLEGLEAFRVGKQANVICMDRSDLYAVLSARVGLPDLIRQKSRRAAEDNRAYVPASELLR